MSPTVDLLKSYDRRSAPRRHMSSKPAPKPRVKKPDSGERSCPLAPQARIPERIMNIDTYTASPRSQRPRPWAGLVEPPPQGVKDFVGWRRRSTPFTGRSTRSMPDCARNASIRLPTLVRPVAESVSQRTMVSPVLLSASPYCTIPPNLVVVLDKCQHEQVVRSRFQEIPEAGEDVMGRY